MDDPFDKIQFLFYSSLNKPPPGVTSENLAEALKVLDKAENVLKTKKVPVIKVWIL